MALGFDWKSRLFDAKLGSAKFGVTSVDTGIGRKNAIHQYPSLGEKGSATYVEDLGQDADEFVIEAFTIQKPPFYNYIRDRDKLIEEIKKPGIKTLTHPFYGKKEVAVVGKVRVKESFQEGGIARFTLTLVESIPDPRNPSASVKVNMDESWIDDINKGIDTFADGYDYLVSGADSIEGFLQGVKSAILAVQRTFGATLSKAIGIVNQVESTVDSVLSAPCAIANTLVSGFDGLMNAAGKVGDTVMNASTGNCSGDTVATKERIDNWELPSIGFSVPDGVDIPSADDPTKNIPKYLGISIVLNSLQILMIFGDDASSTDTTGSTPAEKAGVVEGTASGIANTSILPVSDTEAQKAANELLLVNFSRTMVLIQLARIAIDIAYDNLDDLQTIKTAMLAAIDAMLDKMGDEASSDSYGDFGITTSSDGLFEILKNLRPKFTNKMDERGAELSESIDFEVPAEPMNTLTLAYDRYEDLKRSIEIRERNRVLVKHPGFLPEGDDIKILSA